MYKPDLISATLIVGSYETTMPLHFIDMPPGTYDIPSLIGSDIICDFALFIEHSAYRLSF